jgi:hypothetical protein
MPVQDPSRQGIAGLGFHLSQRRTDMYLFFSPAIAAIVAIAVIQIRDQFRFSNTK